MLLGQEAFEKCWAHSLLQAVLHCHSPEVATAATVARRLHINVHDDAAAITPPIACLLRKSLTQSHSPRYAFNVDEILYLAASIRTRSSADAELA